MKLQKYFSKTLDVLIAFVLLLFFASFGFRDGRSSGWYQQGFPNLNGSTITSMTFLDSLTGYATTTKNNLNQTYILKTTNGGDNWFIMYNYSPSGVNTCFSKVQFTNYNTGYVSTNDAGDFFKTTNGGTNWIDYQVPVVAYDFWAINSDTLLHVNNTGFGPGVYRSINGGINWQGISNTQVSRIYMFNKDIGFSSGNNMWKTTNGGVNWSVIPGESYDAIKFFDTLKGWKTGGSSILQRTTNGGLTWNPQQLPNIGHAYSYTNLSVINKDTVWMIGNSYYFGLLYKTTNGGNNWGYQFADTSVHITLDRLLCFVNDKIGWASSIFYNSEIHTTSGGNDTTFFTGINNNIISVPKDYILYQNYPNPFNPITNIKVQMLKQCYAEIKVFDITGKVKKVILNEQLNSGEYNIRFDGSDLTSGIYFYSLYADGVRFDTKKMVLIK